MTLHNDTTPGSAAGRAGAQQTRTQASLIAAMVLLAVTQLMVVLDTTIVNVALPTIGSSLTFSASGISWVVNGYALAFGALLLFGGRSGDFFGRRTVFITALVVFAAASMLGGLAVNPIMLITARVLQGVSAAFAQATALSLIVSTFPAGQERNRAVGVFAAMEGLGAALGLLLGGVLVQAVSWRWVFFVNVPIAIIVAVLAPRFIPAAARVRDRLDLPGALTSSTGLALIVFGLSHSADHGWTDTWTMLPLAAGVISVAAFILIEYRTKSPLMPLWVFGDRNRGGAYLIQVLMGAALFGMFFLSTLYLQRVLHYGPLKAGAAFLPATVVMMGAAGVMSKLVVRTGVRSAIATGGLLAAAGMLLLSRLTVDSNFVTGVMAPMMLLSVGLGMTFVPLTLSAVSGVEEEHSGLVSGVSTTAIQVGGSVGLAVLATIAATSSRGQLGTHPVAVALTTGYTDAFRAGAVIIVLAVPLALVLLRLRPSAGTQPDATDNHGTGNTSGTDTALGIDHLIDVPDRP